MGKRLDDAVTEGPDGWDFVCPVTDGSCGPEPFTSRQWPTKKLASARGQEHFDEHLEGVAARHDGREFDPAKRQSTIEDFRAKHGVTVTDDGRAVVTAEDLA